VISTQDIKRLREKTGAGVLDCREALITAKSDFGRALEALRARGALASEKRADRVANEGYIATYSHDGRIGVLVELRCETDFVSKNQGFRDLAREIALQVAAQGPRWVSRDDVPDSTMEQVIAEERAAATAKGKNEQITERIIAGKIERFYRDNCLLDQPHIRDDKETIGGLIQDKLVAYGEKILVHRFVRYEIGE
jgi:elongation factor Ts